MFSIKFYCDAPMTSRLTRFVVDLGFNTRFIFYECFKNLKLDFFLTNVNLPVQGIEKNKKMIQYFTHPTQVSTF